MATRFYLPASGAADVNPSFDGGWEYTTNTDRIKLMLKNGSNPTVTALADKTEVTPSTSTQDSCSRQFVSSPLGRAVNFQGTFSLVISTREDLFANATLAALVKVVSNDGGTSRGTLFSTFSTGTEFISTVETRIVNAVAITPLTSQAGDRIVIEVGYNWLTPNASQNTHLRYGNSATSDFALTAALTTDLNPWAEFSMNIPFYSNPKPVLRPAAFTPGVAR